MPISFPRFHTAAPVVAVIACCALLAAGCSKDLAEQMRKDEEQTAGTATAEPRPAPQTPPVTERPDSAEVTKTEPGARQPTETGEATFAPADPSVPGSGANSPAGGSNRPGNPGSATDSQNPALKELHAVLEENIQRLKQGDAKGFLESILPPPQIAQLKQNMALYDAVVASLKGNPARMNQIAEKLQQMRQAEITLNATNSIAEFRAPQTAAAEPGSSATRSVQFQLVDGAWRMADHLQPAFDEISRQSKGAEKVRLSAPLEGGGFGTELPVAIDQAIATLEQGDILKFVKSMFPAGAVRHPDADNQLQKIADRLAENPAPVERMLADLKSIRDLEPQMESDGTVAVYELPVPAAPAGGGKSEPFVRMFRLDGTWRMLKIGN